MLMTRRTRSALPLMAVLTLICPILPATGADNANAPAASPTAPSAKTAGSVRDDLTPQTYAKLHTLIRPHDNEWRHLRVQWITDVIAARKKAATEDRPIVILYTGGAGYNEPLGVC